MNQYLNFSLEGKVALVTGASYGIGFAIASAFAEQGAKICFNDINQELVDKGLASYKEKGIAVHGYVCDVTDEPAVQAMVAQIEKEVGPIDILVNNAGITKDGLLMKMSEEEFDKVIEVNGVKLLAAKVDGVDMNGLRDLGDKLKEQLGEGVVLLAAVNGGKVNLLAMATDAAQKAGAHAGNLIKAVAAIVGGGGGGRPNMAQAGGKNPEKAQEAMDAAAGILEKQLTK